MLEPELAVSVWGIESERRVCALYTGTVHVPVRTCLLRATPTPLRRGLRAHAASPVACAVHETWVCPEMEMEISVWW
jgi:hypothetical protein